MRVLSVGEILWDVFPDKELLGGAALNFSANMVRLGSEAALITGVGCDDRGARARECAARLGVGSAFFQTVKEASTGLAHVTLSDDGEPHFDIPRPAAFDFVTLSSAERERILGMKPTGCTSGHCCNASPMLSASRASW